MKKLTALLVAMLATIGAMAQDQFNFMGIPFGSPKKEFVSKLKEKGFTRVFNDMYEGTFFGNKTQALLVVEGKNVTGISLVQEFGTSEKTVLEFNRLCEALLLSPKYLPDTSSVALVNTIKASKPDEYIHYQMEDLQWPIIASPLTAYFSQTMHTGEDNHEELFTSERSVSVIAMYDNRIARNGGYMLFINYEKVKPSAVKDADRSADL